MLQGSVEPAARSGHSIAFIQRKRSHRDAAEMSALAPIPIARFVALTATSERGKSPKIAVWRRNSWPVVGGRTRTPILVLFFSDQPPDDDRLNVLQNRSYPNPRLLEFCRRTPKLVTTLITQIVRFARPNIQIYDARAVDLYQ